VNCDEHVCLSVRLSVCPHASQEPRRPNFLCMTLAAVTQSKFCDGGDGICYALSVL